jgi:hypothetical protein
MEPVKHQCMKLYFSAVERENKEVSFLIFFVKLFKTKFLNFTTFVNLKTLGLVYMSEVERDTVGQNAR